MTSSSALTENSWDALDTSKYSEESDAVLVLLARQPLNSAERAATLKCAIGLVSGARQTVSPGLVENFLREFSLSTPEGLALMGLAEALLRTPDAAARDRLIAEKISAADWASHLGESDNLFVNASIWGLMLTGRLVEPGEMGNGVSVIRHLAARVGEPVVRAA